MHLICIASENEKVLYLNYVVASSLQFVLEIEWIGLLETKRVLAFGHNTRNKI